MQDNLRDEVRSPSLVLNRSGLKYCLIGATIIFFFLSASRSYAFQYQRDGKQFEEARSYFEYLKESKKLILWYDPFVIMEKFHFYDDLDRFTRNGSLETATLISRNKADNDLNRDDLSFLASKGIISARNMNLPKLTNPEEIYKYFEKPFLEGWDAIIIDEFLWKSDYKLYLPPLRKLRARYPDKLIMAYCQVFADCGKLAPVLDLFLWEFAVLPNHIWPYITENEANQISWGLAFLKLSIYLRSLHPRRIIDKSILCVFTYDRYDDSNPDGHGLAVDTRSDIDLYMYFDKLIYTTVNSSPFDRGVSFFMYPPTPFEDVLFLNRACTHYFHEKKRGAFYYDGDLSQPVSDSSFEKGTGWRLEGSHTSIHPYRSSGLPPEVQLGHALSHTVITHKLIAQAKHGRLGLRMENVASESSRASQTTALVPGDVYEFSAFITSEGNSDGSCGILTVTTEDGQPVAQNECISPNFGYWSKTTLKFKVPDNDGRVMIWLSIEESDNGPAIWWDFIQLKRIPFDRGN